MNLDYEARAEFDECFQDVVAAASDSERALLLTYLYKTYDLRGPSRAEAIRLISGWIRSSDDELRLAVTNALCVFRPVAGCEWVAVEAWRRASAFDLHWCAAAIENAFVSASQIDTYVVASVVERLLESRPQRDQCADDLAHHDAEQRYEIVVREGQRVCRHFCRLLLQQSLDKCELESPTPCGEVDWRMISYVLYRVCVPRSNAGTA